MKSQIFVSQRSCKNYKLVKGKLYYKELIQVGTARLKSICCEKKWKSFLECYLTAERHSGGCNTVRNVKEIGLYYWSNFYEEIKEKVYNASTSHFTLNIAR